MISSAVAFKLLAAALAFANVAIATAVLPTGQTVAFLAAISFAQLIQPLSGFGLVTRLVAITDSDSLRATDHRRYFDLYGVVFALIAGGISVAQGAPNEIVLFAALLPFHSVEAERVRAGYSEHTGIYTQNVAVLVSSLTVLVFGEFTYAPAAIILVAAIAYRFKVPERRGSVPKRTSVRPIPADFVKGIRAVSINQFYSAVVVLSALVLPAGEALLVTLVYRTGLFFNWQLFYWMRYGHKAGLDVDTEENRATNRRLGRLSLLAFSGATVVAIALNTIPWLVDRLASIDETNIPRLAVLIAAYGGVQFALSRTFPFEATVVYRTGMPADLRYAAFTLAALGGVAALGVLSASSLAVLAAVEIARIGFRLISKAQLHQIKDRQDSLV